LYGIADVSARCVQRSKAIEEKKEVEAGNKRVYLETKHETEIVDLQKKTS